MPDASTARTTLAVICHGEKDLRVEPFAIPALGEHDVELAVAAGGICGSDLHYYLEGKIGHILVREPFVLGHEVSAIVRTVGRAVTAVKPGDRVAVNPSRACGQCHYCRHGLRHQCLDMFFYGSAMRSPHVSGGFRKILVAGEIQCVKVPGNFPLEKAAFAEPLAVCLHAVERAGPLSGRKVLVTGAGPIGALTIMAARAAGAAHITATDISAKALAMAKKIGADEVINVATDAATLAAYAANKGTFDIVFECSGNQAATRSAMEVVKARGIIVLVGIGGEQQLLLNLAVAKEIDLRGTFRFDWEFGAAVDALVSGRIDPSPLLTDVIPMEDAVRAFNLAADKSKAMKVQLSFA